MYTIANMSAVASTLFNDKSVMFHDPLLKKQFLENPFLEQNVENISFLEFTASFLEYFSSAFSKTENSRFGVLSLKSISTPLTETELDFIFKVDCSGSMSDSCSDERTKMQHIIHTLTNMILYFKENPSLNVNVTIHAFDNKIFNIVERTPVNETTYEEIISLINTIKPQGSTNIENALKDTKEYTKQLSEEYPNTEKIHIFMTDGHVTSGNQEHSILCSLVDKSIQNVFIGFGTDHDASLLNSISEGDKSNYYFIDKLENAGLVYGEILHGIVYKFLENITITISNGLIYNYNTNTWNTSLNINKLASESNKHYHVVSITPQQFAVKITGVTTNTKKNVITFVNAENKPADLTKYIYRQLTQQILFKVNKYNKENKDKINYYDFVEEDEKLLKEQNKKLKLELQDLFNEIKKYMSDNNLLEDTLLKNLCDDLYICHKTFGTQLGDMFCTARGNSQGQQRAYTATYLCNGISNIIYNRNFDNSYDDDDDEELFHHLSDSIDTPYLTQTMTQVMRSVSTKTNFEEEEETQVEY